MQLQLPYAELPVPHEKIHCSGEQQIRSDLYLTTIRRLQMRKMNGLSIEAWCRALRTAVTIHKCPHQNTRFTDNATLFLKRRFSQCWDPIESSAADLRNFNISYQRPSQLDNQAAAANTIESKRRTKTGRKREKHTGINLPNLRQRQADFVPVHDCVLRLQRIALEIHRVQLLLVGQLPLHLLKRLQLVAGRPQFLEMAQML